MIFYGMSGILDAKYRKDARESFKERTHKIEIEVEIPLEKVGDSWTTRGSGNTASHPGASNAGLVITGVNSAKDLKLARGWKSCSSSSGWSTWAFPAGKRVSGGPKSSPSVSTCGDEENRDTMKKVYSRQSQHSTACRSFLSLGDESWRSLLVTNTARNRGRLKIKVKNCRDT